MNINELLNKNGNLKNNLQRRLSNEQINYYKEKSEAIDVSLHTSLYCILHEVKCQQCKVCSKNLEIENFKIGWGTKKYYCSVECKGKYDPFTTDSDEIIEDYSILLDKNGMPSREKNVKYVSKNTIPHLQELTGLNTNDFHTLLYAQINKDKFVPRYCDMCGCLLKIHGFGIGYRSNQITCSYKCKDSSTVYQSIMSKVKTGISRHDQPNYIDNVLKPWYEEKKNFILEKYEVILEDSLEKYLLQPKYDKVLNFKCISCNFAFTNDLYCNRNLFCKLCNPKSKQQTEIAKFCIELGFDISVDNRKEISPKEIDIYIPSLKIGLEYDGFWWHDNKDSTNKNKLAAEKGIRLIRIFEDEYSNKKEIVLSRLSSILGKTQNKIYARKCTVKEIDAPTTKKFLDENHIQGNVSAAIKYGLFYDTNLVSVMTFSTPRYDKTCQWELMRFASILHTSVVGGASKLFSHFVKHHKPVSIVSYCDLRYGTGGVYRKLGFDLHHQSESNYFYYKNRTRYSRVKFQKHKLEGLLEYFDEEKSETENMSDNNYLKIYDSGNLVFKWNCDIIGL